MAKRHLLLITSVSSTRKSLKKALAEDFDLEFVESGNEALDSLKEKIPAAVIMDHSLEDFHTNQFIDKVRNSPVTRNLPFIMVTRESTNSFVEQGVRSGVSHYIGIPFDAKVLVQKVKSSLDPTGSQNWNMFFRIKGESETQAISFGRVSFVTNESIHFETHLKLAPGQKIHLSCPLTSAVSPNPLEVEVKSIGSDVFYNYPFAVDADWCDLAVRPKIASWILAHKHLNSPKKQKILIVLDEIDASNELQKDLDPSRYSIRIVRSLKEALESFPFMRPSCFIVKASDWKQAGPDSKRLLEMMKNFGTRWVIAGQLDAPAQPYLVEPFRAPPEIENLGMAIRSVAPPLEPDPDRLYFSKTLEDSRCKFFFPAKTLVLGEMGVRLAFPFEVAPPCNMQLALKHFSEQNLRNPYIRVWPPLTKISGPESSSGKYPFSAETHFLGINEQQAQAIRQWLQNEELKDKRKAIADIVPKSKEAGLKDVEAAKAADDAKKKAAPPSPSPKK